MDNVMIVTEGYKVDAATEHYYHSFRTDVLMD